MSRRDSSQWRWGPHPLEQGTNMRKVFWCCAALAVSVAAALYLFTEHYNATARVVGRAVVTAGGLQTSLHATPAGGAEESSPGGSANAMGVEVGAGVSKG